MPSRQRTPQRQDFITDEFIGTVCDRLSGNKRVRRTLPIWGRLHIDRQLPFLCVYRRPVVGVDAGTGHLVTSEASYLFASGVHKLQPALTRLVRSVAQAMLREFGAFLIIELWARPTDDECTTTPSAISRPHFRVVAPKAQDFKTMLATLETALCRIKVAKQTSDVEVVRAARWCRTDFQPLLSASEARRMGCRVLGLEVRPVYRDHLNGELYPLVLRELRRELTKALRRTFYEFVCHYTAHHPAHFHTLGRRAVVKAVWEVDERLSAVSDNFDFLLQVTPVNAQRAWREFEGNRFEREPVLRYRSLPTDPVLLKRQLYATPLERIEDPTLAHLFRQKQDELDRRLTMLLDLGTKRFLPGSLQLYGTVDDNLRNLAERLLAELPPRARDDSKAGYLDADAFARRAEAEITYYREQWPDVNSDVQVRKDVIAGSMVSRGSLLIDRHTRVPTARTEALLQHEVGTHVVTYHNGRAQPFRQLRSGLAGYEMLQEGLAVLAEYLVGGLSRPRLRLLAARVLASAYMIDGASFVDTFRRLDRTHAFGHHTAFIVTMRTYRGGGLTKDALYLSGLCHVLEYLRKGGELEPLFTGKIAIEHVPIIRELMYREVLRKPPLRPRYMESPHVRAKLDELRCGRTVLDLMGRAS